MEMTIGNLKQEIMRIYNKINKEMYDVGVKRQRVDIIGTKIVILAEHQRIPAMVSIDSINRDLTRSVDKALLDINKKRLYEEISNLIDIPIKTILKDYDPETETAGTIIVMEEELEDHYNL